VWRRDASTTAGEDAGGTGCGEEVVALAEKRKPQRAQRGTGESVAAPKKLTGLD